MKFALGAAAAITGASALIYLLLRPRKRRLDPGEKCHTSPSLVRPAEERFTLSRKEPVESEVGSSESAKFHNVNGHTVVEEVTISTKTPSDIDDKSICRDDIHNVERDFSLDYDVNDITSRQKERSPLVEKDFSLDGDIDKRDSEQLNCDNQHSANSCSATDATEIVNDLASVDEVPVKVNNALECQALPISLGKRESCVESSTTHKETFSSAVSCADNSSTEITKSTLECETAQIISAPPLVTKAAALSDNSVANIDVPIMTHKSVDAKKDEVQVRSEKPQQVDIEQEEVQVIHNKKEESDLDIPVEQVEAQVMSEKLESDLENSQEMAKVCIKECSSVNLESIKDTVESELKSSDNTREEGKEKEVKSLKTESGDEGSSLLNIKDDTNNSCLAEEISLNLTEESSRNTDDDLDSTKESLLKTTDDDLDSTKESLLKTTDEDLDSTKESLLKTTDEDLDSTKESLLKTTDDDLDSTKGSLKTTDDDLNSTKGSLKTTDDDLDSTKGSVFKTTDDDLDSTKGSVFKTTDDDLDSTKGSVFKTTDDDLDSTKESLKTTDDDLDSTKGSLFKTTDDDLDSTKGSVFKTTDDDLDSTKGSVFKTTDDDLDSTKGSVFKTTDDDLDSTKGSVFKTTDDDLDSTKESLKTTDDDLDSTKGSLFKTTDDDLDSTKGSVFKTTDDDLDSTKGSVFKTTDDDLDSTKGSVFKTTDDDLDSTKESLKTTDDDLDSTKGSLFKTTDEDLDSTKGSLSKTTDDDLDSTKESLKTTDNDLDSTKERVLTTDDDLDSTRESLKTTDDDFESTRESFITTDNDLDSTRESLLKTTDDDLDSTKESLLKTTDDDLDSTKESLLKTTDDDLDSTKESLLKTTDDDLDSTKESLLKTSDDELNSTLEEKVTKKIVENVTVEEEYSKLEKPARLNAAQEKDIPVESDILAKENNVNDVAESLKNSTDSSVVKDSNDSIEEFTKEDSPSEDSKGNNSYRGRVRNARGSSCGSVSETEAPPPVPLPKKASEENCLDLNQAEKELCSLIDDSHDGTVSSFVVEDVKMPPVPSSEVTCTETEVSPPPMREIVIVDGTRETNSSNSFESSSKKSSKGKKEGHVSKSESSRSRSYKDRVRNSRGNSTSEGDSVTDNDSTLDNNNRNTRSTESADVEPETLFNPSAFPVTSPEQLQFIFYEFEIPQVLVGRLIGRKGAFVKKIKSSTDAVIIVGPHKNRKFKMCSVQGTRQQVNAAMDMIREYFPVDCYPELTLNQVFNRSTPAPSVHATINTPAMQIELAAGVVVEVRVSAVVSGNEVWVQQPLHPSYAALQRLQTCMNRNYSEGTTPGVPIPVLEGTVCVAQINSDWLRCQVLSAVDDVVLVVLLDVGGTVSLPTAALRQIRYDYMNLPFQATQCLLHGIQPPSEEVWDESSAAVLEELVSSAILSATIVSYTQDGVPLVNLYRRDQDEFVFLNERLVNLGSAQWISPVTSS